MLFNSIDFLYFLPTIFIIYWSAKNKNQQNLIILISSYVFYAWWDYRFLSLIIFSTVIDYLIGRKLSLSNNKKYRKLLLACSLISNLGLLGIFKYYNFFVESFFFINHSWS